MKTYLAALCVSVSLLAGCVTTSSPSSSSATHTSSYAAGGFQWREFSRVSPLHASLVDAAGGAGLYMVTYVPTSQGITLSNGRVITGGQDECIRMGGPLMAECYNTINRRNRAAGFTSRSALVDAGRRAVEAEGRCTWSGYDPTLDARARAIGQIASSTDNRFFFARMVCR